MVRLTLKKEKAEQIPEGSRWCPKKKHGRVARKRNGQQSTNFNLEG